MLYYYPFVLFMLSGRNKLVFMEMNMLEFQIGLILQNANHKDNLFVPIDLVELPTPNIHELNSKWT
jgi:hypothetical protein